MNGIPGSPGTDERRLLDAMADELRFLGALRTILTRMDDALAREDGDGVDEAVYGAHRVMQTLSEAQRRRTALVEINKLRAGTAIRGSAMRAAVSRLLECGAAFDAEIRSRSQILERAAMVTNHSAGPPFNAASAVPV